MFTSMVNATYMSHLGVRSTFFFRPALYLFFRPALYLIVVLGGDLPQTVSDLFMVE
jgi:hypothetical protein